MSKNVTQLTVTEKQLSAALNVIAKFFYEEKHDERTGEVKNTMAYTQKAVLNGMIWKIEQLIAKTEGETLPKAQDQVRRAARAHRGDEISEQLLNSRLDWVDTLVEQVSVMKLFRDKALGCYEYHTGEDYHRGQTVAPSVPADATGALARMKAMGLAVPANTTRNSPHADQAGREERMA